MKAILDSILKRSRIFVIFIFAIALFGIYTFLTLDQREIPETNINFVNVTTVWGGADAQSIEENVTNVLEPAIADVEGIASTVSTSQDDVSAITLELKDDADKNQVVSSVNNVINSALSQLPETANRPVASSFSNNFPLVSYLFTADTYEELQEIEQQVKELERDIKAVDGVASVSTKGYSGTFYNIAIDRDAMLEAEIFPFQIIDEINTALRPASLSTSDESDDIRIGFSDLEPLELIETVEINGTPLLDIATITEASEMLEDIISYRGQPSVSLTALLGTGENATTVSKRVEEIMDDASANLDDNIELTMIQSERENVEDIFSGLYLSLGLALIAVVIGTFSGLSVISALIISITIVLSVLIGLIPIPFMDVDLNTISVIGLIIALGIIVDDSIVVSDNIERRLALGDSRKDAMITGTQEVAPSVIASTIAIVFTFLPLLLLSGANGQFIRALPSILITTMIVSTILALFFVPALRYLLSGSKVRKNPGFLGGLFTRGAKVYAYKLLVNFIKKPFVSFIIVFIVCVSSFVLVRFTPFEFFPAADRNEVTVDVIYPTERPIASTHEDIMALANQMELEMPHVEETIIFTGQGTNNLFGSDLSKPGSNTGQIVLKIDKEIMSDAETIETYEASYQDTFGNDPLIFFNTVVQGPPVNAPVIIELYNDDLDVLVSRADEVANYFREQDIAIESNVGEPVETVMYEIDAEALENAPVTYGQAKSDLNLFGRGFPIDSVIESNAEKEVHIQYGQSDVADISYIEEVSRQNLTPLIQHKDGNRFVEIKIFSDDTDMVYDYVDDFRDSIDDGTTLITEGDSEDTSSFFVEIGILFTVIMILVYLVLAWEFNSLRLPLVIVFTILLAFSGGIIGLFITQTPISFLAIMGMVSLSGIVVRNAVVLIDFIEYRRIEGQMNIEEAIVDAGFARFRPIILTMLTSIIALVPVALSGDALFVPLAITIIAGISFSTLLSLIATPSLYYLYYKLKYK